MRSRFAAIVTLIAVLYWFAASYALLAPEPWDAPHYSAALTVAILFAAACGHQRPVRAWRWGVAAILAQLPVLLVRSEPGPLVAVGALWLAVECVPAAIAAMLGARLRRLRDGPA